MGPLSIVRIQHRLQRQDNAGQGESGEGSSRVHAGGLPRGAQQQQCCCVGAGAHAAGCTDSFVAQLSSSSCAAPGLTCRSGQLPPVSSPPPGAVVVSAGRLDSEEGAGAAAVGSGDGAGTAVTLPGSGEGAGAAAASGEGAAAAAGASREGAGAAAASGDGAGAAPGEGPVDAPGTGTPMEVGRARSVRGRPPVPAAAAVAAAGSGGQGRAGVMSACWRCAASLAVQAWSGGNHAHAHSLGPRRAPSARRSASTPSRAIVCKRPVRVQGKEGQWHWMARPPRCAAALELPGCLPAFPGDQLQQLLPTVYTWMLFVWTRI